MEDIEVDYWRPLPKEHYQSSPTDTAYQGGIRRHSPLIVVDVMRYGYDLGNQQYRPAESLDGFKVLYENLTFRNFRALGDCIPSLTVRLDATSPPHTIRHVKLEGLPGQTQLDLRGVEP